MALSKILQSSHRKAIAFSYQPLSCTRGLVLTPQEDPTRTNQEIIVELTKSLTGGNFSYQPGGNGRHGYRSSEASKQRELPKSQDELEPRTMKHSFDHALIPLQSDPVLRDRYVTTVGGIRVGRLVEDMDVFAVHLIHKHVSDASSNSAQLPFSIVTAMVDQISIEGDSLMVQEPSDLRISGHVTWVGRSSAETTINLHRKNMRSSASGNCREWEKIIEAQFVMVAVSQVEGCKAYFNPLITHIPKEKELFHLGAMRSEERKLISKKSLTTSPPTSEELSIIHGFFTKALGQDTSTVYMEEARLETVELCHPEKRNRSGKVFGGHIMRKAIELAWTSAYVFSKQRPSIVYMDDIMFDKPIELGSILYFKSQVAYTQGCHVQVRVDAMKQSPASGDTPLAEHKTKTNIFHLTFRCPKEVPRVVPKTYHEAMIYLNSRRHFRTYSRE